MPVPCVDGEKICDSATLKMFCEELDSKECPLCMEPLEIDDINFYPCKCQYQICRFCWHRLRTDENGLCPACRRVYPDNPANFKPLTRSDVQRIKCELKHKQQLQRIKVAESRKHLSTYRILQKNLVYVIGLSARVADAEVLKKFEYFGKYGRIIKIVVGSLNSKGPQGTAFTAHVTYAKYEDALRAIQAVNNAHLDGRTVKASLGTNKYCSSFLRNQPCHKQECMFLHDMAEREVSFTKDDMQLGRHTEYEKKLIETTLPRDEHGYAHSQNIWNIRREASVLTQNVQRTSKSCGGATSSDTDIHEVRCPNQVAWRRESAEHPAEDSGLTARYGCKSSSEDSQSSWNSRLMFEEWCATPARKSGTPKLDDLASIPVSSWNGTLFTEQTGHCGTVDESITPSAIGLDTDSWQVYGSANNFRTSLAAASDESAPEFPQARLSVRSDDDLGFDPYSESAKGLADLLEEEKAIASLGSVLASNASGSGVSFGVRSMMPLASLFCVGGSGASSLIEQGRRDYCAAELQQSDADGAFASHGAVDAASVNFFALPSRSLNGGRPPSSPEHRPLSEARVARHGASGRFPYGVHSARQSVTAPFGNCSFTRSCVGLLGGCTAVAEQRCCPSFPNGALLSPAAAIWSQQRLPTAEEKAQTTAWQEQFKAFLPTANVRFLSEANTTGFPLARQSSLYSAECGQACEPLSVFGGSPLQRHSPSTLPPVSAPLGATFY